MAEKKIQARIRQKVDTKANWDKATNFVPLKGEYIYYSDLHKVKVGDGVTKVGALPFLADSDTHFTTGLYIGPANTKANGATTNGNTYLKAYDDNTKRAQFLIHGSGASSVSSDANGNITISSTDNDTHFTTGLYVGKVDEKSNSATTNGNTYLKLFDNDTKRSQHLIHGTGLTTVASDASGTITINSTLPTNLVTTDTEQTVTGTKHFNAITANTIGTGSDANNYFQSQKIRGEGDANTYYHAVDFGYAGHDQVDFYEYGGVWNFYRNQQADTSAKKLLFGINPSGIKLPTVTGVKVLGTNADGQVESHTLGIADISSLQSTLDGKVNSSSLATVAKTGSYNDLSNKPMNFLDKGSASTNNNQVVYNPVEMKKALTVPSVQGTKYTDNSGNQQPLFTLGGTASGSGNTSQASSSLTLYRNRAGFWDSATIRFAPVDGLKIGNYAVGVQDWNRIPASYILTNGDGVTKDYNGGVKLKSSGGAASDDFVFESTNNGKLHSKMSVGPNGLVRGGWCIDDSKIITEATLGSAVGSISSESILSICI